MASKGIPLPGRWDCGTISMKLNVIWGMSVVFFTWEGFDEMDDVRGDGSAELDDDGTIEIEFRYHLGDEAILKAQPW